MNRTNVKLKIIPFGQISIETPLKVSEEESKDVFQNENPKEYVEPVTSGLRTFEVVYEQHSKNYVVPLTTG